MFASALLKDIFFKLLIKTDHGVAASALKCLFGFKLKFLTPYREQLERFAGDATYRDEMIRFPVRTSGGVVQTDHRRGLILVLIRLLYGRLLQRKGRSSKDTPASRRAAILSFFSGCVCARSLHLAPRALPSR